MHCTMPEATLVVKLSFKLEQYIFVIMLGDLTEVIIHSGV